MHPYRAWIGAVGIAAVTLLLAVQGNTSFLDPSCSFPRSDVGASGATDLVDVTKVTNVAFRGMFAGSQFDVDQRRPGDQQDGRHQGGRP